MSLLLHLNKDIEKFIKEYNIEIDDKDIEDVYRIKYIPIYNKYFFYYIRKDGFVITDIKFSTYEESLIFLIHINMNKEINVIEKDGIIYYRIKWYEKAFK